MAANISAILFDVGGTLRFTETVQGREQQILAEMLDFLELEETLESLKTRLTAGEKAYRKWSKKSLVELTEEDLWTRFMLPDYSQRVIRDNAVKLNQWWRNSKGNKRLLPDAIETIKELSKRGYKLSIISNTTSSVEVPELLKENGVSHLFSSVILSSVYGRRKPHPALFLDAARRIDVHPEDCAYIGDRPSRDVVGAREAGYGTVVIIEAKGLKPEKAANTPMKPDHLIHQLKDLLEIFPVRHSLSATIITHAQPDYLYDAAFSTMWGVGQKMAFKETFRIGRELGFPRFELNHAITPSMFGEIDFNRYRVGNVHDPCPAELSLNELKEKDWMISSLDEDCRKKGVEVTLRTIDLAVKLGADSVILHPGQVNGDRSMDRQLRLMYENNQKETAEYESLRREMIADRKRRAVPHLDSVIRSLKEIIDFSRPLKINIGLENRYRYYDIPVLDELPLLLDLCNEPWYGFQYDVGHSQALGQLGLCGHQEWLKRYGSRIVGVHFHDVIGLKDHQAPGKGEVDFKTISKYLPEFACRTLEIGAQASQQDIVEGMEVLVRNGCVKKI